MSQESKAQFTKSFEPKIGLSMSYGLAQEAERLKQKGPALSNEAWNKSRTARRTVCYDPI